MMARLIIDNRTRFPMCDMMGMMDTVVTLAHYRKDRGEPEYPAVQDFHFMRSRLRVWYRRNKGSYRLMVQEIENSQREMPI